MKDISKKNELLNAYRNLWKIMNNKDRVIFCVMTVLSLFRCFAVIMTTQILACLTNVISGQGGSIFGIHLPDTWNIIQVVIFCHVLIAIVWIISVILSGVTRKYAGSVACKVNAEVLKIINTPRKNLDFKMSNGEAVFIANHAGESVIYLIRDLWLKILVPIFSCVIALVYIAQIDVLCFVIFLCCFVVILLSSFIRLRFESKYQNGLERAKSKINNVYLNNIDNISLITMLASQEKENEILDIHNKQYKKQWFGVTNMQMKYWFVAYIAQYALVALGVIVCILRKGADIENLSNMVSLVSYSAQLCSPLESVGVELGQLQVRAIQFNRLSLLRIKDDEILDNVNVLQNDDNNIIPTDCKIDSIKVQDLHVRLGNFDRKYPDFTLHTNKINVIQGDSGIGKSILIGAILGIKSHDGGMLKINDKYAIESLYDYRDRVSLITQNAMIFDRSVLDNITYPNNDLSNRIEEYIKIFNLDNIASRTYENDNAMKSLSGGEQKRISLIRGMSKNAEIYIFDEPTNDLDNENVDKVIQEIIKLKDNAMVIVISHDKRIMKIADSSIKIN